MKRIKQKSTKKPVVRRSHGQLLATTAICTFMCIYEASAQDAKVADPAESAKPQTSPPVLPSAKIHDANDLTLKAAPSGRDVPLRVTYPVGDGPFPVIIFCHGALGSKDAYQPLAEFWAENGYVVIRPTFGDSFIYLTEEEKKSYKNVGQLVASKHVTSQWKPRVQEVGFIIDKLGWIQEQVPALKGKLNASQVAVAGHSYGAQTTMFLAGMQLTGPLGRTASGPDNRPVAFIAISPPGTGAAVKTTAFKNINKPVLMITGDKDGTPVPGNENKFGNWRKEAFDNAPAGDRYLLWIDGAEHNFGGISGVARKWTGAGPDDPKQVRLIQNGTLLFLNQYVKNEKSQPDLRGLTGTPTPLGEGANIRKKVDGGTGVPPVIGR